MPSLILSRASETDIDELLDPLYAAFKGNDLRTMFFGHDTPASRASAKARIAASMKKGGQNVWLKVIEKETGKVISGSWWMIYPNWVPSEGFTETAAAKVSIDYLEGDDRYMGEAMLKDWMMRRARYMYSHSHLLLALLFTDPTYQKCGAGSMQVQWGTTLADQLFVPMYIEGTPTGHHLYAKNGAADLEKVRFEIKNPRDLKEIWINEYTMMRREPCKSAIEREKRARK
ncbi:hypothetical protein BT96DRAFT_994163 [Gymnopus androsaceus JB14]|uniref:N-acetyltransferase domain-containing protein n=1 Tax=Gymnopus androsaceus JB14 TaxID=1447944 RepID=A0A6A4HMF4_9AGAR|nr:hypothetical protein BT96DRAFT_994163 [Gymnopus androsaceus JB14]